MIVPPVPYLLFSSMREDVGHMYGYVLDRAAELDIDTRWPICSLTLAITLALFVFDNLVKL